MGTPKSGKTAPVIINTEQLETLAGMGCTLNEMAAFFKCSVDSITRNYAEPLNRGRENGKVSVRRMMWDQGKKGNSTALKYLVHNVLKEKVEEYYRQDDTNSEITKKLADVSSDVILKIVKDYEKKAE